MRPFIFILLKLTELSAFVAVYYLSCLLAAFATSFIFPTPVPHASPGFWLGGILPPLIIIALIGIYLIARELERAWIKANWKLADQLAAKIKKEDSKP